MESKYGDIYRRILISWETRMDGHLKKLGHDTRLLFLSLIMINRLNSDHTNSLSHFCHAVGGCYTHPSTCKLNWNLHAIILIERIYFHINIDGLIAFQCQIINAEFILCSAVFICHFKIRCPVSNDGGAGYQ